MKNWGVIGGVAAAVAAGMYVLWGPITERKRRRKGRKSPGAAGPPRAPKTREKSPKRDCYVFPFRLSARLGVRNAPASSFYS